MDYFYTKTFSVDEMKELDIDLKEVGTRADEGIFCWRAPTTFPACLRIEKLHGQMYIDGVRSIMYRWILWWIAVMRISL